MGLLDVLTGMRNGPRGHGGGGMSPITMALLGLLPTAARAFSLRLYRAALYAEAV